MPGPNPNRPSADHLEEYLLNLTRRRFFGAAARTIGAGMGTAAMFHLLGSRAVLGADGALAAAPGAAPAPA